MSGLRPKDIPEDDIPKYRLMREVWQGNVASAIKINENQFKRQEKNDRLAQIQAAMARLEAKSL